VTEDRKPPARLAIVEAFSRLVLAHRTPRPPVADLLEEAGVARSTFYEHFDGRDAVLIEAFEGPLAILADAAAFGGNEPRLKAVLDHLRENRKGALDVLAGNVRARMLRRFADMIAERLSFVRDQNLPLELAEQQLGLIRLWLAGETRRSAADLAARMLASAEALRESATKESIECAAARPPTI
jgi:AcrR family transcriptional regulator